MAQTSQLKPEEVEKRIDEFEEILLSLQNPKLTSLNEEDIELLSQIKLKLESLPTTSSFDMKSKAKISPFGAVNKRKTMGNLRSVSQKIEIERLNTSPRFVSRSEIQNLNMSNITLPLFQREEEDQFKFEEILMSLRYFSKIILEKAVHCERFRIASINSDISIKTADHFIKHFSQIIFDVTDVAFIQNDTKTKNEFAEIYGSPGDKIKIRKFLTNAVKEMESGKFVCLSEKKEIRKQLKHLFGINEFAEPLLIAKKFIDGDSENIFLAAVSNGENSILQMLFEQSKEDPELMRYLESALIVASRILYQFTTDTINKNLLFFDLLDIENIYFAHSKSLLINMLAFTYKDDPFITILRKCDEQYKVVSDATDLLLYQFNKTSIIFKKYSFAIQINRRSEELYSFSDYIESIVNELIYEINKKQSSSQAMIKAFHKDLTKVIIQFDMENKVINQTRHFFSFMEREFRAPYILSKFDPVDDVTLFDITKDQDLRMKLMSSKDKIFLSNHTESFEFKKTIYTLQPVFDPLCITIPIGYMLSVQSNSEKLLENVMQNRLSLGKKLRLNFNKNDGIEKRISESLKFLNQIYGASKTVVQKILYGNIIDLENVEEMAESDDNVTLMMSEYVRPEVNLKKKIFMEKVQTQKRVSVFASTPQNQLSKIQRNPREKSRKQSMKPGTKLDIESITKSYMDPREYEAKNPIESPGAGGPGARGFKMSRFALVTKSKENTDFSGVEIDSVNSNSLYGSSRRIDISSHRNDLYSKNLKHGINQSDSNPYLDISHLDFSKIDHFGLKRADINFLEINESTELYKHAWAIFSNLQIVDNYHISPHKFTNFIKETESYYERNKNPFHNFRHGMTVMNQAYSLFKISNLAKYFTQTGIAALIFAGLMHDIEHTGRNNLFEINSCSKLAIRYNDNSVLENHHSARSFKILEERKLNIFEKMHQEDYPMFRKYIIQSIMSTDIKRHFTQLPEFKQKLDSGDFNPYENGENIKDFLLMIGVLLHCCDLYTPALKWKDSVKWNMRLNKEFRDQSEEEAGKNIPLTPFLVGLDNTQKLANSEKYFITAIVTPLWLEVDRFLQGAIQNRLKNIEENLIHWRRISDGDEEVELYNP